jgi:hypothetical protein
VLLLLWTDSARWAEAVCTRPRYDHSNRVVLNGQIRVRQGWGGGGAWCGGGVVEAWRTQGTRQLEV